MTEALARAKQLAAASQAEDSELQAAQQQQQQQQQFAAQRGAVSAMQSFLGAHAEPAAEPAKTGSGERDVPPVPGAARAAGKRERPAAACFGDETQTEYVRIEPAPRKRPRTDALTEHQRETAALQRQGAFPPPLV